MLARNAVVISLMFAVSACGFVDKQITLNPRTVSVESPSARTITDIELGVIADDRQNKQQVGEFRNAFGQVLSRMLTKDDAANWLKQSLANTLRKAGYKINEGAATGNAGQAGAILTGEITHISTRSGLGSPVHVTVDIKGAVHATIKFHRDGKKFEKPFRGIGHDTSDFAVVESNYQRSLDVAMDDLVSQVSRWINTLN